MAEVKLDASEVMQGLTLTLRMPKAFGFRMRFVGSLVRLARLVSPVKIKISLDDEDDLPSNLAFDVKDASTWQRYEERTPEGGIIALTRYPEGYRLRYHGEVVWRA